MPTLGKDVTAGDLVLDKRHILNGFCELAAIDAGDLAPTIRDEMLRMHEPPPKMLRLRLDAPVMLTVDAGGGKRGDILVLVGLTDKGLTCHGAGGEDVLVERVPFAIYLSVTHGGAPVMQSWTRLQFPVAALPSQVAHAADA